MVHFLPHILQLLEEVPSDEETVAICSQLLASETVALPSIVFLVHYLLHNCFDQLTLEQIGELHDVGIGAKVSVKASTPLDLTGYGRFRTRNFGHFHVIFHSVVQTNMKCRFVSYSSQNATIKAIYPLVVLREMPLGNEIDTKKVHELEGFFASRTTYDTFFIYFTKKD